MERDQLRRVPWFAGLADTDLDRICRDVSEVALAPDEVLFREGDPGDHAYVVLTGQLEVVKQVGPREVVLAVRGTDQVLGELALLEDRRRAATVRARGATELIAVPRTALDYLLATSPDASRKILQTLLERVRENDEELRHQERMAQLGTLTAGVAHELNNPAAAAQRSIQRLRTASQRLVEVAGRPVTAVNGRRRVLDLLAELDSRPPVMSAGLDRADAEDALTDWLAARGTDDALAATHLVDAGVTVADVEVLVRDLPGDPGTDAVDLLVAAVTLDRLTRAVGDATSRISHIVGALRSHSHLDRAPILEYDVTDGLEQTLVLLAHRTRDVRVIRDLDPDLPRITAYGGDLNQVWTNLIDNACAAMATVTDREGVLTIRTRRAGDRIIVDIEDTGPGIAPEHRHRIFDAFFTTKPVGEGTGLGLRLSHRIVALDHRGDLQLVEADPGRTVFRVELPISQPLASTTSGPDV